MNRSVYNGIVKKRGLTHAKVQREDSNVRDGCGNGECNCGLKNWTLKIFRNWSLIRQLLCVIFIILFEIPFGSVDVFEFHMIDMHKIIILQQASF